MVTRSQAIMSSNTSTSTSGSSKQQQQQQPDPTATYGRDDSIHEDAIVMATAMAKADQEGRSPGAGAQQSSAEEGNHREDTTDDAKLPSSPMVTPPIRSFNSRGGHDAAANEMKPPAAVAAAAAAAIPVPTAGVPHVYHDYSLVPDVIDYVRKKTGGVTQPFPEKLHEMLRIVDNTEDAEIVSWLPHGRAFLVRKPKEFTDKIMLNYFKQTKLTSFQRQLNLYGFRRITQGTDAGAYYHEMFLRARPALCQRMARQKVKGTGHKQPADAKTEPNFYLMRPVEPYPVAPPPPGPTVQHPHPYRPELPSTTHNFGSAYDPGNQHPPRIYSYPPDEYAAARANTGAVAGSSGEIGGNINIQSSPVGSPSRQGPQVPPAVMDSPASPGLHGAAHLLQGIAAGYKGNLHMPSAASLGPAASPAPAAPTAGNESEEGNGDTGGGGGGGGPQHQGKPASFLQPRVSER